MALSLNESIEDFEFKVSALTLLRIKEGHKFVIESIERIHKKKPIFRINTGNLVFIVDTWNQTVKDAPIPPSQEDILPEGHEEADTYGFEVIEDAPMEPNIRKRILVGDYVIVPDPDEGDIHNHSFSGTVTGFRNGYAQIVDGDGDIFEIEPDRLELDNEEDISSSLGTL